MRRSYPVATANRNFLRAGCQSGRAVLRSHAASPTPRTKRLWVDDFRTNIHHTLKTNPLQHINLDDFVACFHPEHRFQRKPNWDADENQGGRWRAFEYDEVLKRDKVSLDVLWLKYEAQEDSASLPEPDVIAAGIAEDLRAALEQFEAIAADLASAN